jgi:hypothetical protein
LPRCLVVLDGDEHLGGDLLIILECAVVVKQEVAD